MPFKSEKQRRYLWANEPEIARDWTDTYGSGIAKALGGRIGLWTGGFPNLTQEMLHMTYPDQYYKNVIEPAKMGTGQMPSKMQMLSKAQPFKAMRIGIDPYLPKSMQAGYDAFRAAPTSAVRTAFGSNLASGLPLAYAYGAGKLQENIPEELQGVISDDIISQGAMGAGAGQDAAWDAILRGSTANVPEGIIRPGMERLDPTDANYIARNTNYPESQDLEAQASGMFTQDKRNLLQKGWDYAMDTNLGQKMRTGYNVGKEKYVMPAIGFAGMLANQVNPLNPQSRNYNPELQGQIDQLKTSGILGGGDPSGPYKITSGPLAGKNLVSAFGTNDYDEMLAKKIGWFEKRKAEKKTISDKAYKKALEEQKRREEQKRTQGTNIGGGWRRHDTGGGRATFRGPKGQSHQGWSNTPAGIAAASASEGSFAEGGLAGLWRR